MTGFNHGMTGAVIAITVKKPELAVPLAFLSHFLQDAIPHWDYGTGRPSGQFFSNRFNTFLISDFLFSLVLMVLIGLAFPYQTWLIVACMIAAASPDLMWGYYYLYLQRIKRRKLRLNWLARLHSKIEWSESLPGAIVEVLWFAAAGDIILQLL
jgi:hypothetical protein